MNEYPSRNAPDAQYRFLQWIKVRHPSLYERAISQSGFRLGDFKSTISTIFGTIKDTLTQIAPAYLQTRAEIELLKLNIARAKQGLTPVDSLPAGAAAAGASGSGAVAATGAGFTLQPWMLLAGAGLLFLLLRR